MSDAEKKLVLHKFGAPWCGPCQGMAKAKTLEKFESAHPDVEVKIYDIDDDASNTKADEYDVEGIPAFIVEDVEGHRLARLEGATNLAGLEKLYKEASENLAEGNFGKVSRKKRKKRKA